MTQLETLPEYPAETTALAALLEAGCTALAFQERLLRIIALVKAVDVPITLSTALSFGRTRQKWMNPELFDALQEMDTCAAAAAATSMRKAMPEGTRYPKFLIDAATSLLALDQREVEVLIATANRARASVQKATTMSSACESIMESLIACRRLTRLAGDNGSFLDADAIVARYELSAKGFSGAHPAERVLCKAFGTSDAFSERNSPMLAKIELVRSLSFMAYELCYRDNLLQLEARARFDELAVQSREVASRLRATTGATDALTASERAAYDVATENLAAAGLKNPFPLSGRVIVMAPPVVTPRGRVLASLQDIQRSGQATRGFSEFAAGLEGGTPSVAVDGYIPLYIDPEEASRSLHDSLLRAMHATGNAKIGPGDIICITRGPDMADGPRSMFMSRDAVAMIRELRSAGFVILTGLSADASSPVDKAADAAVETPAALAVIAKGLILKHKLEETAVLRLRGSRKAGLATTGPTA